MTTEQKECYQCGNCCKEGGPALHSADIELVRNGDIPVSSLITIRKGELGLHPVSGRVQPVSVELVKIVGSGRQWVCCYFSAEGGCTVYEKRPLACRTLKCWDTEEVLGLVEKDTLSRIDLLEEDDPIIQVIQEHERVCPCEDLKAVHADIGLVPDTLKKDLEKRVRADLRFRARIISDFELKVSEELFYFGRPLFQLLQQLGVRVSESRSGIHLEWPQ